MVMPWPAVPDSTPFSGLVGREVVGREGSDEVVLVVREGFEELMLVVREGLEEVVLVVRVLAGEVAEEGEEMDMSLALEGGLRSRRKHEREEC